MLIYKSFKNYKKFNLLKKYRPYVTFKTINTNLFVICNICLCFRQIIKKKYSKLINNLIKITIN